MAKCIVFGGNGFLGSYLVDELVQAGHSVAVFGRPSTGSNLYVSEGVTRLFGDLLNENDIRTALSGQDYVFHFVSTTTPATADSDPVYDIQTNIVASVRLFEQCVDAGIKRVYFASSGGAIYGDQTKDSFSEEDKTCPVSPYAIGKLTIENYLRFFLKKHGLDYVVFRISNPYGERQNLGKLQGVIPIMLRKAQGGEDISVIGDGTMVRDYIAAEDAAAMMIQVVNRADVSHHVYNIGSGSGSSVNDVVDAIKRASGVELKLTYVPKPPTFVDRITLDIGRYEGEFGAASITSLEDGVAKLWSAFSND